MLARLSMETGHIKAVKENTQGGNLLHRAVETEVLKKFESGALNLLRVGDATGFQTKMGLARDVKIAESEQQLADLIAIAEGKKAKSSGLTITHSAQRTHHNSHDYEPEEDIDMAGLFGGDSDY